MTSNELARNLLAQVPGREYRHANAASAPNITRPQARRHKSGAAYRVNPPGCDAFIIEVKGRVGWALDRLREAGPRGCAPVTEPAPRWSSYVHDLRAMGVEIESVREEHGGEFPGAHGRYVLRSAVSPAKGGAA